MFEDNYKNACSKVHLPKGVDERLNKRLGEKKKSRIAIGLVPALVCAAVLLGIFLLPQLRSDAFAIAVPELPEGGKFHQAREEAKGLYADDFKKNMLDFTSETLPLVYKDGENLVYSPVSFYYALTMASLITGGETRDEIISALGTGDYDLYHQARLLFQKSYYSNSRGESKISSSVWLNDNKEYNKETLEKLSEELFAWSYSVPMGTDKASSVMETWLDTATEGLLDGDFETHETDEAVLISALYFRDLWVDRFDASKTEEGIFHSPGGDVECDFMNMRDGNKFYFYGENFGGTTLNFQNSGSMAVILPDEGYTVEDILNDRQALDFAVTLRSDDERFGTGSGEVILSIPKFDIDSGLDLKETAEALGIETAFDGLAADFSPVSERDMWISSIMQSARLSIDEKGCEAGVYTSIELAGAAPPNGSMELILDRPFIFIISAQHMPLFVGVVNCPTE